MKRYAISIHRYAGLFMAGFLFVSGATGSVIVFHREIDEWLNQDLYLTNSSVASPHEMNKWSEEIEQRYPKARVRYIELPRESGRAALLYLGPRKDPVSGKNYELRENQVFVNPETASILGDRNRGSFGLDRRRIIPFLYLFHFSVLAGSWGIFLFGIAAVVWFLDSFVALYLVWPKNRLSAWKESLSIKIRGSNTYKFSYDLHRAAGLWFWPVLLTLAFSGIYFNLHDEIFKPTVATFSKLSPDPAENHPVRSDINQPLKVSLDQASRTAEAALIQAGLEVRLGGISVDYLKGIYEVRFHTANDLMTMHAGTLVHLSAETGRVLGIVHPNSGSTGDILLDWQFPLHSGKAFGWWGRILIFLSGVVTCTLVVTGLIIWWKKRGARSASARKAMGLTSKTENALVTDCKS